MKAQPDNDTILDETARSSDTTGPTSDERARTPAEPRPIAFGSALFAVTQQPSEESLEQAIAVAELEGRRTVADALARRLDDLRAARSAGNVVPLKRRASH